jgi:hypothetical protein
MKSLLRTSLALAIAVSALVLPGCATIVKGTSQPLTISTDPPGAKCVLNRDGMQIGVVDPTPGTVEIGKVHRPIAVDCKKVGYEDANDRVQSRFQTVALGNILLGGIIGFGVDAMSGAMYEYPSGVTVALVPVAFVSAAERDTFFDRQRDAVGKDAEDFKVRLRAECKEACEAQLKAVDDAAAAKRADIEARRSTSRVREGGKT